MQDGVNTINFISVKPRRVGHRQDYAELNDGEKVLTKTLTITAF